MTRCLRTTDRLARTSALLAALLGAHAAAAQDAPDLAIGAAQFPDDDAVILRWEQHWEIDGFGKVHCRDHKWVKLLDRRAIGRYADQRLDFSTRTDDLVIHVAQTHLPDGTILPVPDYSFNIAAPNDVAGWPLYAEWQQQIVSFSGVQDGCILELDYEAITQPGAAPWLAADLRLRHPDPAVQRIITVTIPADRPLLHRVDRFRGKQEPRQTVHDDGRITYAWRFENLAALPDEDQSPPWQQTAGRLRFITCQSAEEWVSAMLGPVTHTLRLNQQLIDFANEAVGDADDPREMADAIAKKINDSFNVVESAKTMRKLYCRKAAEVFHASYGNPLEAGALFLAACRALELDAEALVAVDARFWHPAIPTNTAFAAIVAKITTGDDFFYVHPTHGVFTDPGTWGRHTLLRLDENGAIEQTYIWPRSEKGQNRIDCTGNISLAADGTAAGTLNLNLSAAFFDPLKLETDDEKKKLIEDWAGRVVTGFQVAEYELTTLTDELIEATIEVKTAEALPAVGDGRMLTFGDGPLFLAGVPMPLDDAARRSAVETACAFNEVVDLTVTLPPGWKTLAAPQTWREFEVEWAHVFLDVTQGAGALRFKRDVRFSTRLIGAEDFRRVRQAVNTTRAASSRSLLAGP